MTDIPVLATRGRREPWWTVLPAAITGLSLGIVVSLWLTHQGLQDFANPAGALVSLARLSGLVSADLLLVQVLAMARIPWVERSYGQDTLARWHRLLGFSSFFLLLGHIALSIVGYAVSTETGLPAQTWELVVDYPGMVLATAGTALLTMVVVTSMRAARRRLRYESWHLLHLYSYLGIGLGIPHQLWTGTEFLNSPAARTYWWGLYGCTLGAVVVFRLGQPVWRNLRHRLRVAAVVAEGPGVVSIHLEGRHLDRMGVRAGQFLHWRFLDGPGWSRSHPYSLSAAPRPDRLRITVKELGDGSSRLRDLRPGTRALVEGPFGRLTADVQQADGVTMIASGIGITPLRALLEELDYRPGGATVIYRARQHDDLVLGHELNALASQRGARIVYLLGKRARGSSWLPESWAHVADDDALRHLAPDIAATDVFICGPPPWMDAVRTAARAAGVPSERIHVERFDW